MSCFLNPEDNKRELALEDVFLVQQVSDVGSRRTVNLTPHDFDGGTNPLVVANMNAASGRRMAEVVARYGGIAILPQDHSAVDAANIIRQVKTASVRFDTAVTVTVDDEVHLVRRLLTKREARMVCVIDSDRKIIGVVTADDIRDASPSTKVRAIMRDNPVTGDLANSSKELFGILEANRLHALPVVDENGTLQGTVTKNLLVHQALWGPSLNKSGELVVGAAIGLNGDIEERVKVLVGSGVDVLVVDTAHGAQRNVTDSIRRVRNTLAELEVLIPIVAGNVCTYDTAAFLFEAGADIAKINVGPGAMCTTRMQTGVGRPSFSAVYDCSRAAQQFGRHVWADGGVKNPRDVALYLAAGASRVMFGTAFAGTYESPAEVELDENNKPYKSNYGMASYTAVQGRTQGDDPFEAYVKGLYREGISGSRVYIRPGQETVGELVLNYVTGVQSAFTYTGASNIAEFADRALIGVQTAAGYHEGTPHGAVRK